MHKTFSKSRLFRRAWQLKRLNPTFGHGSGFWLKYAWMELKVGNTGDWIFGDQEIRKVTLKREIERLEGMDRLGVFGLDKLSAARRELAGIRAA